MGEPSPLKAWPDVPARVLLCRDDRLFPASFLRRVEQEGLGLTADEIDGGHTPALTARRSWRTVSTPICGRTSRGLADRSIRVPDLRWSMRDGRRRRLSSSIPELEVELEQALGLDPLRKM